MTTAPVTPTDPSADHSTGPIPFMDLRAPYLAQQTEIDAAVRDCMAGGWYVLGKQVAAFEAEFAAYLAGKTDAQPAASLGYDLGCVGVNSGTDALQLALRACDVGPGDEVITVAHTAVATAAAIILTGARPVFVDIDPETYTLDPAALAPRISPRVKAIVPVHLYGQAADMEPILAQARAAGIRVIEDCAQAHGATYRGRAVGTWGDLACFSFYPTKNLGAMGDGGAVVGRAGDLLEQVRLLREYGWTPQARYVSQAHGMNSRLDEMQAAILRVKLRALDEWNATRHALAAVYAQTFTEQLAQHPGAPITLPGVADYAQHVYHLYVIRTAQRDALQAALTATGMGTGIHYPVPIHRQPAYAGLATDDRAQSLPVTERIAGEILSLPMHPFLAPAQARRVATAITQFHTTGSIRVE